MPWTGTAPNQTYVRTDGTRTGTTVWQQAEAAGIDIVSDDHDTHDQDIGTAMNAVLKRDGGNTAASDIPMGGYKFTNVAAATARDQFSRVAEVQDSTYMWCGTAGGTGNAITLTPTPAITAYVAGQVFRFVASASNTGPVTVAVSGLAAQDIEIGGAALATGAIESGKIYQIIYDGTDFQIGALSESIGFDVDYLEVTADYTITSGNRATIIEATGTASTLTFDDVANLGDLWSCWIENSQPTSITLAAATSQTIDGVASITMKPDEFRFIQCDGTGIRSFGMRIPSNVAINTKTDTASTTTSTWADTGLSVSITLRNAGNRVKLRVVLSTTADAIGRFPFFRIVRGTSDVVLAGNAASSRAQIHFQYSGAVEASNQGTAAGDAIDTPGSVGPHTYKVQWYVPIGGGTAYLNRSTGDTDGSNYGRAASTIIAEEIGA